MIYLQQFNFKIEHRVGKKMPYVDYLFRLPVEQQMIHELKEPTEKIFIGQVCRSKKAKYVITFIYNAYRSWMSVITDWKKKIYDLHQSLGKGLEPKNSNSLKAILRKLREETTLKIYHSRAK